MAIQTQRITALAHWASVNFSMKPGSTLCEHIGPDLTRSRSASETLELRREPKLAREIIMRFVARNITMLRQRRLPVTAGTVYLAHFAGGAGAVAILPAPDNFDAALVIVNADSTGRTKRERLTKTNPFLEHFTVADLKSWAERKMRGPNLRLAEADSKP
jgi:hypothetical protein